MREILTSDDELFTCCNLNCHDLPFVISIPHSGTKITKKMNDQLLDDVVLTNMDWYLPELYDFLKDLRFTVIISNISRYVIDPNRKINACIGTSYTTNLVYKETTQGYPMYKDNITNEEINERITTFYKPYHGIIQKAIDEKLKYYNKVYLIDLHSFGKDEGGDVIIGNRHGRTASNEYFKLIRELLENQDFKVTENRPFSGGYITSHYGKQKRCEVTQIELWYQKYIDKREFGNEELPVINRKLFKETKQKMYFFFLELIERVRGKNGNKKSRN